MALLDDLKAARARARKMPSRKKTAKKRAKKTTKKTAKKRAKKTTKKTAKKRAKKTTKKTATKRAKKTAKKTSRRPRGELLGMTGDLPWRIYREPKETEYHYGLRKSAMKMAMSHVKPAEVLAHPVKR